jgi:hypothetical protein
LFHNLSGWWRVWLADGREELEDEGIFGVADDWWARVDALLLLALAVGAAESLVVFPLGG